MFPLSTSTIYKLRSKTQSAEHICQIANKPDSISPFSRSQLNYLEVRIRFKLYFSKCISFMSFPPGHLKQQKKKNGSKPSRSSQFCNIFLSRLANVNCNAKDQGLSLSWYATQYILQNVLRTMSRVTVKKCILLCFGK